MAFDAAKARELMDAEKAKREQAAAAANPAAEQGTTWTQDRMAELNTEIADSTPEDTYTFDPEESRAQFNAIGDLVSNTFQDIARAETDYVMAEQGGDEEEIERARVNALRAPFKESARQFIAAYADDNSSAFQDMAQGLRQSSANIEYFMTPEEKLETARKINQRLPMIPGGAMLASTEAMQGAMFAYDMAEKLDAVGGNMENVYRQIPALRTISAEDPMGAAIALKDIKHVYQAKSVLDSFRYGWEHGNANYEYGILKMKEAYEGLTDDERDEAEKLERKLRQTEQYYPSFFVDPLLAMASGVESLPEMIYTTAKSIPYGVAGAAIGAALTGAPTYGAGAPAGAAAGFTWGRRAGMAYEMFRPMMGRKFAEYQSMTDENGAPLMTREQARDLAALEAAPEALIEMGAFELGIWKNISGEGYAKQAVQNIMENGKNAIAAKSFRDFALATGKDLTIGTARETLSEMGEEFLQTYPDAIVNAYIENAKNVGTSYDISLSRLSDTIENLDWSDVTKKAIAQSAAAAPGSLLLGALSGGVGVPVSGVRYGIESSAWMRQWGEMAKTERTTLSGAIMLDQLQATVRDSKLKDAAPDVQREIIRDQAKDTPWQMAYVNVDTALEAENGEEDVREVGRAAGKSDAEVEAAIANRGVLAVPVECYAQSKASPKLLDSVSFSEDAEPLAVIRKNAAKVSEAYNRRIEQEVKKQVELTETMTNELFPDSGEERDAALASIYTNPENPAQGWRELYDNANAELDEIIAPAVAALESGMGQGTSVVETVNEIGEVSSGRVSNNAEWYREWYKEHKRPPTQQEKRDMAKLMVMGDVNAPQVQGWRPTSGEEAAAMESMRERVTALDNEINTLNSIKERMQTLSGTEMQLTAGLSPEAYKVYRTINSTLRGIGGKQARAARIGALMMARHADVMAKRMQGRGRKDYTALDYMRDMSIRRGIAGATAQEAYSQSAFDVALSGVKSLVEFHDRIKERKAQGEPENKIKFISPSSGIVFPEEQTVHAVKKHHLTDENLADIDKHIGEIQDIEISAKQPARFHGISVLGKVVGDEACYGVVLEITINGEILFKTAFKAKESAVDAWIKKEKNAEGLSLSKDSAGTDGRSSKLNIQESAEEVKTRADLFQKLLPNWWYSESVPKIVKELRKNGSAESFDQADDSGLLGRTLSYETGERIVELFENADESTFLHETGHIFLMDLQVLAEMGDEESIADLLTVNEWAEWHDGDAAKYKNTPWAEEFANREKAIKEAKKSGNQKEEERLLREWKQERFARAFEIYLYEGKAPSKGLRKVFEDFVKFLTQIYNAFTTDGARASEQVEAVMSRLMATDEEIESASLDARYENFTAAGGEKLLDEDAKETFDRWHAEAKQEAKDKLRTIVMRDLKKRAIDQREKFLQEERTKKEEELSNQPVYLARQAIRESGIKDAWKAYFTNKAEWEAADAAAPTMEDALDTYVKNVATVYDVDQIQNDFPEETVEAAMSEAPYHERLVELERQAFAAKAALVSNLSGRAQKTMDDVGKLIDNLPDEGSPADNAELQDAVTTLRVSARWTREELRELDALAASQTKEEAKKNFDTLRRTTEGRKVGLSDLREANRGRIESLRKTAKDTIARQTLAQATQVQTHRQEERDAAREAQKYAKKNNWTEAARAKERELFASLMATEAKKTRDRMDAVLKKIRRQLNAKTKLPKDERYWHQHLAYLLRITDKDAEIPAGLESIQTLAVSMGQGLDVVTDEDGQSDIIALLVKLADPNTNKDGYRGMTLNEFEDAADALTALYVTGRDKFNMKTVKGKTVQDVVEEILQDGTSYNGARVQQSRITGNPNRGGVFWNEMIARIPGAGDTLAQYAQRYGLSLTKPEELINLLGQKAHRYLYDTYDRAAEQEAAMTADFVSNMQTIIGKYYKPKELRDWQARVYNFNGEPLSKENVLAMAMNMGNDINMDRLIMGLGVNAAAVEKFLTENMTEKDWLFCQNVWDLLSTYWPDTVRVEMELNGTRLKPQTARAFTVQSKDAKGNAVMVDLRGGYYPIKYDPEKSTKAGEQAENALAKSGMSGAMVLGMGRGFTKDRAAKGAVVDRPLLLSLSVIPEHCGEAIHNITTRIAARDVYRLINDGNFRQYVESTLGIGAYKVLRTWATDVWKVQPENKGEAASWLDQPIRKLRQNSGIAIMGYRMWPTIENLTNFFPMMDALGAAETMSAIGDYYSNKKEFDEIIAKSMFMRERTERMERDMKSQRSMFERHNAVSEWLVQHAYDPITTTDLWTSKPLWARAYKNAFPTEMENLRKENEDNAATFEARRAEFDALNAEVIDLRNRRTAVQEELRRRDLQQPVLAETEFTRMSRSALRDEIRDIDRKIDAKGREVFVAGEKMSRAGQLIIRTEKEMLDEAEHRAILAADKAVREVIGSGDVKDQSEVQRSRNELVKALTMFYSYFNTQANAIIQAHWRGKWQGGNGYNFLPLARALAYRFMLTAALSTAMRWVFFAEGDDDKDKYKKDKDGNKIEVPVLNRVLKQYAKNMLSTSIGGLYFVREVGNWAINYLIDGQVYGGGARFDGMYGSFLNQILKEGELILKKHERDEKAKADEEKRRAKYDKMTPAQKKKFREEQKYRKPPNTISYADILRGAGEIGTRLTAGTLGITDPIADAVLGTMQYIFDSDGRYDATLRNMMWSAFWTKKPVKRTPPEKPQKPNKKGR